MLKLGLKTKLTLAFAFLGLMPIFLTGGMALYVINYTHGQDVATMEDQLLNQKSSEVQKFLDDTAGLFEIKVGYNSQTAISDRDQKFLGEGLLQNPNILEVSFADIGGQETFKISNIQDASLVPQFNLKNLAAFQKASAGEIYFGPVEQTAFGPLMTIAGPISNESGSTVMVVMGKISLSPLTKLVSFASLGNSGYLYIVDKNGFVIASAQKNFLGLNVRSDSWINTLLNSQKQSAKQSMVYRQGLSGEEVLSTGLPLSRLGWGLVAEWPKEDAFSVVREIRAQVLELVGITLIVVLLLGWLFGRRVLNSLKILKTGAAQIGKGNFNFKVNINTGDEFEEFGAVLNTTSDGLKRLEELKEEFVFVAAHELRTPVTAIKGYLSMIDEAANTLSPETKQMLGQVSSANQRLVQLVEDLLQVARSEAGRLIINVEPINITPAIQNIVTELLPLAKEKNIQIAYYPAPLPKIMADAERVKEILVNLVGNAIKYTLTSGTVTISHLIRDKSLITNVSDTGIGMTLAEQAKLFEKFYRIKNNETKKIQGTGLGLFIVKQIVEKMGGKIWVTSKKGAGSTFSFSLSLAPEKNKTGPTQLKT